MKGNKQKTSNKSLIILLSILSVLIIGLTVGIILVRTLNTNNNDDEDATNDGVVLQTNPPEEIDIISTEGQEILSQDTADSLGSAMQYFDEKSAAAADTETYFMVESVRAYLLLENNYPSEAILYLDKVQQDNFDEPKIYTIYSYYQSAYNGLGEEAKAAEYQSKMDTIIDNAKLQQEEADNA